MDSILICGIYKITSPTGRVYIGESKNIFKRWRDYKNLINCKSQTKLYRSLNKHDVESHIFEVIEECEFYELLCRERYWQDFYDVLNGGLNCFLSNCGDIKKVASEETKKKQSEANKGNLGLKGELNPMFNKVGDLNPMFGRKHTQEAREKISKSKKLLFKDHIPKVRYIKVYEKKDTNGENNPFYGKKHSLHSLKLMSVSSPKLTGSLNPNSKIILCTQTGIFYECIREASEAYGINYGYLRSMLSPNTKDRNKTNLIVV